MAPRGQPTRALPGGEPSAYAMHGKTLFEQYHHSSGWFTPSQKSTRPVSVGFAGLGGAAPPSWGVGFSVGPLCGAGGGFKGTPHLLVSA